MADRVSSSQDNAESLRDRSMRYGSSLVRNLRPRRLLRWPAMGLLYLRQWSSWTQDHPLPSDAVDWAGGLAGFLNDHSALSLMGVYRAGLYPEAHSAPTKLWCPPKRWGVALTGFDATHALGEKSDIADYTFSFDRDFAGVLDACRRRTVGRRVLFRARPRLLQGYLALHEAGLGHCYELRNSAEELVGGGFGIALGRVFFSESAFSTVPGGSRIAATGLNWHLARWGFVLNDMKTYSPLAQAMGAQPLARSTFLKLLDLHADGVWKAGRWQPEASLQTLSKKENLHERLQSSTQAYTPFRSQNVM